MQIWHKRKVTSKLFSGLRQNYWNTKEQITEF